VDLMALDRVGLTLDRLGFEQLVDVERQLLVEVLEAVAALPVPPARDLAAYDDAVGDALEGHGHVDRAADPRRGADHVGELRADANIPAGAGVRQEICDVDSESGHGRERAAQSSDHGKQSPAAVRRLRGSDPPDYLLRLVLIEEGVGLVELILAPVVEGVE